MPGIRRQPTLINDGTGTHEVPSHRLVGSAAIHGRHVRLPGWASIIGGTIAVVVSVPLAWHIILAFASQPLPGQPVGANPAATQTRPPAVQQLRPRDDQPGSEPADRAAPSRDDTDTDGWTPPTASTVPSETFDAHPPPTAAVPAPGPGPTPTCPPAPAPTPTGKKPPKGNPSPPGRQIAPMQQPTQPPPAPSKGR